MTQDCISVSFVGVYEQYTNLVPTLDSEFCRQIFGLPDTTITSIGPDGLVITIRNRFAPAIMIGTQRLIIKANDEESLRCYVRKVKEELAKKHNDKAFLSFGINYEYQWLDIKKPTEEWLWSEFINSNIVNPKVKFVCSSLSLRASIKENEWINISLSPRIGRKDGLYADINHHHNKYLEGLPREKEMGEYLKESKMCIEKEVLCQIFKKDGNK